MNGTEQANSVDVENQQLSVMLFREIQSTLLTVPFIQELIVTVLMPFPGFSQNRDPDNQILVLLLLPLPIRHADSDLCPVFRLRGRPTFGLMLTRSPYGKSLKNRSRLITPNGLSNMEPEVDWYGIVYWE